MENAPLHSPPRMWVTGSSEGWGPGVCRRPVSRRPVHEHRIDQGKTVRCTRAPFGVCHRRPALSGLPGTAPRPVEGVDRNPPRPRGDRRQESGTRRGCRGEPTRAACGGCRSVLRGHSRQGLGSRGAVRRRVRCSHGGRRADGAGARQPGVGRGGCRRPHRDGDARELHLRRKPLRTPRAKVLGGNGGGVAGP